MAEQKITSIALQERNKIRVNIYINDGYAFSLHRILAEDAGLKAGLILSDEDIARLQSRDTFIAAQNRAYRLLSYRPRSEAEIKTRLLRSGSAAGDVDAVVFNLKSLGLLDDEAFANYWKEHYGLRKLRGKAVVKAELRRKGIDREIVDKTVEDMDDYQIAYAAGAKKIRTLKYTDHRGFRQKLGTYLLGRGFSYESVNRAVRSLWEEINDDSEDTSIN